MTGQELYLWFGQPFDDVSWASLAGIVVVYFLAFAARGAIGFGAIAPAIVLTSWLIPPHHAVLLAMIAATIPQLQMLPEGVRDGDWKVCRPVFLALALSIAAGVWLFAALSSDGLSLALGAIMTIIIVLDMGKWLSRLAQKVDMRTYPVAFSLATVIGLVTGVAGAGGMMMLSVYLRHACRDHISLRATAILLGTMLTLWRVLATAAIGLIDWQLIVESALLMPVVYAGIWIGTRWFRGMTPKTFYQVFQLVLLISAAGLMIDGLLKIF
ncbi:MAG: sulfite exporter TauE/SafE family protein [Alphaproteobacteria bacterium]